MSIQLRRAAFGCVSFATLSLLMGAQQARAAEGAADSPPKADAPEVQEVIVTAAKGKAADAAPVKSSLKATEPEAVITRKFIEEAAPRVGDYTTTAILAPSMATIPNPNGSGATDGAKLTMRGFQDGEYNVTYDGVAWGDTNGPSHHSNSFFPSSVIGGVVIDRGPGQASDLGQANFGGSVNLFSLPFEEQPALRQTLTAASFGTYESVTTLASGPIRQLHDANFVVDFMEYKTDGYLSNSPSDGQNQFVKGVLPFNDKWSMTALFTRNQDEYHQGDASATATVVQTQLYGKRFALSDDPTLATYKGYNDTHKQTDFEYIRLNGDLGHDFSMDNTVYSYFYSNLTVSANNNAADASLNQLFGGGVATAFPTPLQTANTVTTFAGDTPTQAYPKAGKGYASNGANTGIPGYTKRNAYRVIGDIVKFYQDTPWGKLTVGAEYEHAFTQRQRFDYDLGPGLGLNVDDFREKAAVAANASSNGHCSYPIQASNGACDVPLDIAYSEFSGWNQLQPFAEFEWKPTERLTIEPGIKYVDFRLFIHAPELAVSGSIQPAYVSGTYTKTLPFLTANYKLETNWSIYAQYAQGFLVPNVSAFYVNAPQNNRVVPQESTNYQIGTVFSAGKLTFDGDLYYIDFKHKIQTITIVDPTSSLNGETYESNSGGAHYKGVEAEATYLLPHGFSVFGDGSLNSATANGDPFNPGGNGRQIAKAPRWTAAVGLRYEHDHIFGDDALVSNLNTKWIGEQFQTAASGTAAPTGLIHSFNETDWTTTYRWQRYSVEFQVLNLLDNQDITSFKGKGILPGTTLPATSTAQATTASQFSAYGANVFTYQPERSFQLTVKAAF